MRFWPDCAPIAAMLWSLYRGWQARRRLRITEADEADGCARRSRLWRRPRAHAHGSCQGRPIGGNALREDSGRNRTAVRLEDRPRGPVGAPPRRGPSISPLGQWFHRSSRFKLASGCSIGFLPPVGPGVGADDPARTDLQGWKAWRKGKGPMSLPGIVRDLQWGSMGASSLFAFGK